MVIETNPLKKLRDSGLTGYRFIDPLTVIARPSPELKEFYREARIAFDRYATQMLFEAEQQEITANKSHPEQIEWDGTQWG